MPRALEGISQLVKELEKGSYNARPGKLRQGCCTAFIENPDGTLREPTEEEMDAIYEQMEKERDAR